MLFFLVFTIALHDKALNNPNKEKSTYKTLEFVHTNARARAHVHVIKSNTFEFEYFKVITFNGDSQHRRDDRHCAHSGCVTVLGGALSNSVRPPNLTTNSSAPLAMVTERMVTAMASGC